MRRLSISFSCLAFGFFLWAITEVVSKAYRYGIISTDVDKWLPALINVIIVFTNLCFILVLIQVYRGGIESLNSVFMELERLRRQVHVDKLTGLLNRYALSEVADEFRWPYWSVILLDLDDFKKVNDCFGHLTGDHLLGIAGGCISRCIRSSDLAFRYGGEEFLVICPETSHDDAFRIGERIRQEMLRASRRHQFFSVSVGVAGGRVERDNLYDTIGEADSALYEAKRLGKNQVIGRYV